jgi:hypothetical protein
MKKTNEIDQVGTLVPPLLLQQVKLGDAAASALKLLFRGCETWGWDGHCGIRLFALVDVADGGLPFPAAAAVTVDIDPDTVELRTFSVNPGFPEGPMTGRLVSGIADRLRAAGTKRLVVAAGRTDEQAARLSAAGFDEPYPGGQWLEIAL